MSLALKKSNLVTVNFRSVLGYFYQGREGEGREGNYWRSTVATKVFFRGSQKPQRP